MMKDNQKQQVQKASGSGISFCSLLTIVFITLKLLGKITWSWWWVLAPLWLPVLVIIGILIIVLIIIVIADAVDSNKRKEGKR